MSDAQFILCQDDFGNYEIRCDSKVFHFLWEVAPILNEQQDTINKQLDQIIELQDKYRILEFNHSRLEKRNKSQYGKIDEQQATINQLKEELKLEQDFTSRWQKESEMLAKENERLKQKIHRWKTLYEIKDKEVTARVDALNKVCEYYTSEVLFKSDVDPNEAVHEVINRILNTEVKW